MGTRSILLTKKFRLIFITNFFTFLFFVASAQPALKFAAVLKSGLNSPVYVTNSGDSTNRLFIVEKGGVIKIYDGTAVLPIPFLDISKIIATEGEQGLMSVAFHPDYKNNRYFFIYYNSSKGNVTVARYQTNLNDPNVADTSSAVILLSIPKPTTAHNGGTMMFGNDGYLYLATGDGGLLNDPANTAQNGKSLLGKMLRIHVETSTVRPYYTIPSDNPFVNDTTIKDEIWSLGLRNPFRWSFDKVTGNMWIGDVGANAREKISFESYNSKGGNNYGWRCYEGSLPYDTAGCMSQGKYVQPIFEYDHSISGGHAIIGGMVYRGDDFPPLYGYYICIDFTSSNAWLINSDNNNGWEVTAQSNLPIYITAFGEGEDKELYAVALSGTLYKVQAETVLPFRLINWQGELKNSRVTLSWETTFEQDLRQFDIEYSFNGLNFSKLAEVAAKNIRTGSAYHYTYNIKTHTEVFYRLKIVNKDGGFQYSKVISLYANGTTQNLIYPSVIDNGLLNIQMNEPFENLAVYSADGKRIFQHYLGEQAGRISLELPVLSPGIYLVRFYNNNSNKKAIQKIMIR